MNWYLAKLVFRIICGAGDHRPQFDEQLHLIKAGDAAEALKKAYRIGYHNGDTFLNHHYEPVQWKFVNVPELVPLHVTEEGIEMYSRIEEPDDLDSYLSLIHHKASVLRNKEAQSLASPTIL